MQGWGKPTGSAQASVYWLRRLIVIVVFLTLVGLLAWGVGSLIHRRPAATEPTVTPTTTAAVSDAATRAPAAVPKPAEIAPVGPPKPCDFKRLSVSIAGPAVQKASDKMELTLSAKNEAGKACILGLTKDNAQLVVMSGSDTIWTSQHCYGTVGDQNKQIEAGQAHEWKVTWDVKRSTGSCDLVQTLLGAGTYNATFAVKDAAPSKLVFQLV